MKKFKLRQLMIDRADLVDKGANPEAYIELYKRDQSDVIDRANEILKRLREEELEKRTPGIRRALKALARAKKRNKKRIAEGKKPIVQGKEVSASSLKR